MARDKKTPQNDVKAEVEAVQDQENTPVEGQVLPETDAPTEDVPETPEIVGEASDPETKGAQEPVTEDQDGPEETEEPTPDEEEIPNEPAEVTPQPVVEKVVVKRGGIVPALLGARFVWSSVTQALSLSNLRAGLSQGPTRMS
ncbi:hypothetical protein [Celeribacter baekdonensis]|uniref:Uncharacterized protein n=1 Tax=Celeribacter baekdonensis TaxID=875171 RepID=A0A2R4M638_9RHOB|nr:hypothetical protein [Celeribacter baekdonensis]AVW92557.1 hypothetical protein DA792_16880 [Celeribacter baekdonensis]